MSTPRRHFTGAEKVAILKRHLVDEVPVLDLCDDLKLYPTQFYALPKEFFENGHAAFDMGRKAKAVEDGQAKRIEFLEANLRRKNEVLAEQMEEHTLLKRALGEL
jgi:hypothetical protein